MTYVLVCLVDFFFQAEDGIRDLVRSRGLGDVYKRQSMNSAEINYTKDPEMEIGNDAGRNFQNYVYSIRAVSYTHLTLPTSDLV